MRPSFAVLALAASVLFSYEASACVAPPDIPDLAYEDSDCDGIDGTESLSFFVSLAGLDSNAGTKTEPFRTIQKAADAAHAHASRKHVLVMAGTYDEGPGVTLRPGVSIFGGYNFSWVRTGAATAINGAPQAVFADSASGVTLQLLQLSASQSTDGELSVYGVRAMNGSALRLESMSVLAGAARSGAAGTTRPQGTAGANGSLVNAQSGKCLDANGGSAANGTQLIIWSCHGGTNQRWTLP